MQNVVLKLVVATMNAGNGGMAGRAMATFMVAGFVSGAATYFISLRAFMPAVYLGAPVVFILACYIAYALLHRQGRVRLRVSASPVTFVSVAVVVVYPVVGTIFDLASAALDRWMRGKWSSVSAFLALIVAGLLAAVLAWIATTALTRRPDKSILLLFMFASVVSAMASSLASSVAVRNMNAGYQVVLLLFPGVLFGVGMTLFGVVFGYAIARASSQRNIQAQDEKARQPVSNS